MSDKTIEELRKEEIQQINNNNNNEELDANELEKLILQGSQAEIPIIINYPIYNGEEVTYKELTAFIKPLTNTDANNAYQKGARLRNSTPNIELVKIGLYDKNMKHLKPELVEKMPSGVIDAVCKQLMDVSGIKVDKEQQLELARRMMDF